MEGVYTKKLTCPVCKSEVYVARLKHGAYTVISRDSDLHPWVNGVNPIYYVGAICANCGYAALESHFEEVSSEEIKKLLPLLAKKRLAGIKGVSEERTWEEALYVLSSVFEQYEIRNADPYNLGYVAQNIAWLYREVKDEENEQVWLEKALQYYLKAYESSAQLPATLGEAGLGYLIADLYARLGNYRDALQWASRVVQMPKNRKKVLFEQLSRELWQDLREKYKSTSQEEKNWRTIVRTDVQRTLQSKGVLTTTMDSLIRNVGLWVSGEIARDLQDLTKEDIEAVASFEWFNKLMEISSGHRIIGDISLAELLSGGEEEPPVYLMPELESLPDMPAIILTDHILGLGEKVLWEGYGFLKGRVRKLFIVEV